MKKGKSKGNEERRVLVSTFEAADSLIYAAMATARDGVEDEDSGEHVKRFLVIGDLLKQYRETVYAAIDGKAA